MGCVEHNQKEYEVDCIPRGTVARMILRRNKEGKRVPKAVVEELVVRSVVGILVWLVLLTADLEDPEQTCGPAVVSGERHAMHAVQLRSTDTDTMELETHTSLNLESLVK